MILEEGGWVKVEDLLKACARNNFPLSLETLKETVEKNDKKRFSFDETGDKIRANQGHSVEVNLQLKPQTPPAKLFHGTAERNISMIEEHGLLKMARHHVHLSADTETARKVGMRYGKPVIFEIDTVEMLAEGFEFYLSENSVWLVETVPPKFLKLL